MERQLGKRLDDIRADHRGRYKFASHFTRTCHLDAATGCGYGAFILSTSKPTPTHIIAVDRSLEAIEFAKSYYLTPDISYYQHDLMEPLPRKFPMFSSITCLETIEHLPNPQMFFDNIASFLLPACHLTISCPNELVIPFSETAYPFHYFHFTPNQMEDILKSNSFTPISVHHNVGRHTEDINVGSDGPFIIYRAIYTG